MSFYRKVTVWLFDDNGHHRATESWRVPRNHVDIGVGDLVESTMITDVIESIDSRRINGGAVFVPSEGEFSGDENFGITHLFPPLTS